MKRISALWTTYRRLAPNAAFVLVVAAVAIFVVAVSGRTKDVVTPAGVVHGALPAEHTAAGTAARALRYVAVGNSPAAILLYHARVRQAFGVLTMVKAFSLRRPGLRGQTITVASDDSAPQGRLVILAVTGPQGSGEYSFTLSSTRTGWRVVYDSFFGDALAEQTSISATRRLEPNASTPSLRTQRRADREAERASDRYRRLIVLG